MTEKGLPLNIDKEKVEEREYQIDIFNNIKNENSLVVIPTGLGKTIIATFLIGEKLDKGKKSLFMAPTKPLCEQHKQLVSDITKVEENKLKLITGELFTPEERKNIWYEDHDVYFATPQVVNNDLRHVPLNSLGLMIFDEAHRASGDYAYVEIAKACKNQVDFLGLTASPATSFDDLVEICANLSIENIEARKENSEDVKPYVSDKKIEWVEIEKSEEIKKIEEKLDSILKGLIDELRKYVKEIDMAEYEYVGKSTLIDVQEKLQNKLKRKNSPGYLFHAVSLTSASIKVTHWKELILSQGLDSAYNYFLKLKEDDSRAAKYVRKKEEFDEVGEKLLDLKTMPIDVNKKLDKLKEIFQAELNQGKAMVFAHYRDTVDYLVDELKRIEGLFPTRLVGQSDKKEKKGMSQNEQKEMIEEFEEGEKNVLISTSIGEEGLDIPSNELVVFYEPVPSAIRYIQRKGRTGRDNMPGKVYVLFTSNSKDEIYQWKSYHEEKKMYHHVEELKEKLEKTQEPDELLKSLLNEQVSEQSSLKNY